MSGAAMLQGELPDGGMFFAAIDSASRCTTPQVCQLRFAAMLAPFTAEDGARAALTAAGADIIVEVGR